ncbi:MAG TPA: electron transfer flavoprotein subunit alpha/FixB family protein [Candidatus Krumholzibacteria bacterium]|jgi:electron transfer flavoprotein alpha subunit
MAQGILVIAEHRDGQLKGMVKEALSCATTLRSAVGGDIHAVVLGADVAALATELAAAGADKVWTIQDPKLAQYTPEAYIAALQSLVDQLQPKLVLTGHSYQGIDFFPRLAASLDAALFPDVTAIESDDRGLVFTRKVINGKLDARCRPTGHTLSLASLQQGAFQAGSTSVSGSVESFAVDLLGIEPRNVVEIKAADKGEVDLSSADVIVAGGRGLADKDKFKLIFQLAEALGAAVGASRPPCDSEWTEHERQIGSSGQVVAPKLYIAVGISGAIQHVVGMRGSQCVVAINKDPNAAIFQEASYGLVGDLFEIVPALIAAVNEAKS